VGGYGLPDLTEIYKNLPASVHDLRAQVENTLLKFEPRLRSVGIEISDNADPGLLVSFTMVCHLRKAGLVRFGTFFEPPRRMRVERLPNPAHER
jgi:type VI secretion system protein